MNQLCKECFHRQVCGYTINVETECRHFAKIATLKHEETFNVDRIIADINYGNIDKYYFKILINTRIIDSHCSFLDHHQLINCKVDRSMLLPNDNNAALVSELQFVIPNKLTTVSDAIDDMLRMED